MINVEKVENHRLPRILMWKPKFDPLPNPFISAIEDSLPICDYVVTILKNILITCCFTAIDRVITSSFNP